MKFLLSIIGVLLWAGVVDAKGVLFDGTDAQTVQLMQAAEESIEANRKGVLSVTMVDSTGAVINASAHLELLAHSFDFGTSLYGFHKLALDNPAREPALKGIEAVFNTLTVCNYWSQVHWGLDRELSWTHPDNGYQIADELEKRTRHHALLFGFPRWLHEYETEEAAWGAIENRMRQVGERYGDRIRELDVINEFINYQYWDKNPHAQYLKTTHYPDMAKPENGARALRMARKYFPKTKLVVLESNLWSVSNPVFQEIYEYHKELIRLKAPYDYIGYQAHYFSMRGMRFEEGTPDFGPRTFMMDAISRGLDQIASLGKPIVITEFNGPTRSNKNKDPNQPGISAEALAAWESNFYTLIFSKPYMVGLSRWFTIDSLGGRGMDAGIVTEAGQLKPNYYALKKLIKEDWHTQVRAEPSNGEVSFEGFYGTYRLRVDGFEDVVLDFQKGSPARTVRLRTK